MMATLLEIKGFLIRVYTKYDWYVKTVMKFILALISFLLINSKAGFMQQLKNPLLSIALALLCAFLPLNATVVFCGLLLIVHAYALSLEACAVTAGLLLVMFLLYFRISSRYAVLLILPPICYLLGIPYVVSLTGGLLFGPAAAIPAGFGSVIYYLIAYMSRNSTSLATGEIDKGATKIVSLVESLAGNKEMFICILAMVLTVLIVYFIRRLSIDHSWELAIGIGTFINVVLHLVGALIPGVSENIVQLLIGSIVSAVIALAVKFCVFSVDYTRTERVQFEDDEYYYYVKAVPKNVIAQPKKTVKKIFSQKKQTKTVKRIDS